MRLKNMIKPNWSTFSYQVSEKTRGAIDLYSLSKIMAEVTGLLAFTHTDVDSTCYAHHHHHLMKSQYLRHQFDILFFLCNFLLFKFRNINQILIMKIVFLFSTLARCIIYSVIRVFYFLNSE